MILEVCGRGRRVGGYGGHERRGCRLEEGRRPGEYLGEKRRRRRQYWGLSPPLPLLLGPERGQKRKAKTSMKTSLKPKLVREGSSWIRPRPRLPPCRAHHYHHHHACGRCSDRTAKVETTGWGRLRRRGRAPEGVVVGQVGERMLRREYGCLTTPRTRRRHRDGAGNPHCVGSVFGRPLGAWVRFSRGKTEDRNPTLAQIEFFFKGL